jgi:hypothetical protein
MVPGDESTVTDLRGADGIVLRDYMMDTGEFGSHADYNFELVVDGEADPSGVSANTPGAKLDSGKLRPRLVLGEFSRALTEVVKVGTKGAEKYSPRGWLSVPNGRERYAEAADRHQLKVNQGVTFDDGPGGTGERHKAQVIWNLLAELELELREAENGSPADAA